MTAWEMHDALRCHLLLENTNLKRSLGEAFRVRHFCSTWKRNSVAFHVLHL